MLMKTVAPKIHIILKENNLVSVEEYAEKKRLSLWYVRKLCRDKRIKCLKIGGSWLIEME